VKAFYRPERMKNDVAERQVAMFAYRHVFLMASTQPQRFIQIFKLNNQFSLVGSRKEINDELAELLIKEDPQRIILPDSFEVIDRALSYVLPRLDDAILKNSISDIGSFHPTVEKIHIEGLLSLDQLNDASESVLQLLWGVAANWVNQGPRVLLELSLEDCEDLEKKYHLCEHYNSLLDKANSLILDMQEKKLKLLRNNTAHAGDKGEDKVNYVLKWLKRLDESYQIVEGRIQSNGKPRIRVSNEGDPAFRGEAQEIDHVLVGPPGVILIETKYYKGKITIDPNGTWIRDEKVEESPAFQVERHRAIITSILPKDTPVYSIICVAHPSAIIEGKEHSPIPIVKYDMLLNYLKSIQVDKALTDEEIRNYVNVIKNHLM
jgi:hypothetical protein